MHKDCQSCNRNYSYNPYVCIKCGAENCVMCDFGSSGCELCIPKTRISNLIILEYSDNSLGLDIDGSPDTLSVEDQIALFKYLAKKLYNREIE